MPTSPYSREWHLSGHALSVLSLWTLFLQPAPVGTIEFLPPFIGALSTKTLLVLCGPCLGRPWWLCTIMSVSCTHLKLQAGQAGFSFASGPERLLSPRTAWSLPGLGVTGMRLNRASGSPHVAQCLAKVPRHSPLNSGNSAVHVRMLRTYAQ